MGRRRQLYRLRATGGYDFDEGTKRVDSPSSRWRRMGHDFGGGCDDGGNNFYGNNNIDDNDDDQKRSPFRVSRRRV